MTPEQHDRFLNDVKGVCAMEIERVEHRLGRTLTFGEKSAFEIGFMTGHSMGQKFALQAVENLFTTKGD